MSCQQDLLGLILGSETFTLLATWQKEQTIAGNIFSREQKHRPGSQGTNFLCGTEQIV